MSGGITTQNAFAADLLARMGGVERFAGNWNWRSHNPNRRAQSALDEVASDYEAGVTVLVNNGASPEQITEWADKLGKLWIAMQAAGSRVANPMVTGPARFPVERNRKAMAVEAKRIDEYFDHARGAKQWLSRRQRSAERAAASEEAKGYEHETLEVNGLKLVLNLPLERVQLLFPGKPDDEMRAALKSSAFRWSPREGAWQRKSTIGGVRAAKAMLAMWAERGAQ